MADADAGDDMICSYAFTYDANGRIETETRSDGEITSTMTYDDIGRVLSRVDTDEDDNVTGSYTYTYDAAGNITSGTAYGQTAAMAYDTQNRLTTYNGQSVTYDADGNMTSGPLGGILTDFVFDSGNRLIEAGDTEYAYDAENNRVSATADGQTTEYVYDAVSDRLNRLLISTTPDDESTYYVYGIGLIGQEDADGAYSVYHFDTRGSTTAVTDIDGDVTDRYTYGVYGDLLSHTGTSATPFLYNGRDGVMTDANGLYYLRARYYSPELMRFINADMIKGDINDSRTLNNYAYANGDPVSLVDPFGTSPEQLMDMTKEALEGYLEDKIVDKLDELLETKAFTVISFINGAVQNAEAVNLRLLELDKAECNHYMNVFAIGDPVKYGYLVANTPNGILPVVVDRYTETFQGYIQRCRDTYAAGGYDYAYKLEYGMANAGEARGYFLEFDRPYYWFLYAISVGTCFQYFPTTIAGAIPVPGTSSLVQAIFDATVPYTVLE